MAEHPIRFALLCWGLIIGFLAVAVVALKVLSRRVPNIDRFRTSCVTPLDSSPFLAERSVRWLLIGAVFLACAFAALETMHPFYFSQDDALVAELPGIISGCRSIWTGVWPDYDPSRLMGGPLAGAGLFSLTYPPTEISYAIARNLLRNEFLTLEVFAAIHLLAGYFITTALCRRVGMRPSLACCATLSFILSGSILIMGRSWHAFLPIVVWMPLLMMAVVRLSRGPVGWKWVLGTGVTAGILYHVGFPQLWIYAVLLTAMAIVGLLVTGRICFKRFIGAIPAGFVALGVAAPLLYTQWSAASSVIRPPLYGEGITSQWIAALVPYPLVQVAHPMGWGSVDVQYMGHFVYFGTTFAVLFVLAFIIVLSRSSRRVWGDNIWLACAILALLMTTGDRGGVFFVLSKLPLLNLVSNNPFRALPFFVLFAVIGSGIVFERMLQGNPKLKRWGTGLAVITIGLLAYHVAMARPSFYTYGFKPYPPLAPAIARRIEGKTTGRIMSWSPERSISPSFAAAIPHNLPMLYGMPAFSGYDPLLEWNSTFLLATGMINADPAAAMRAYGIRWFLISPLVTDPVLSPNREQNDLERTVKYHEALHAIRPMLKVSVKTDDVRLDELDDASLMAFPQTQPSFYLPVEISNAGIDVDLKRWRTGGEIVVNFLWYPQFRAYAQGKRVPISRDQWQRLVVRVPAGARLLKVRYVAEWGKGIAVGAILIAMGLGWALLFKERGAAKLV